MRDRAAIALASALYSACAERDEARAQRDSQQRHSKTAVAVWRDLYHEAVGVPPSKHQARRLEEMAKRVESVVAERDEARAERDHLKVQLAAHVEGWAASQNHLQAVREFAHGLGASTATRADILDACTRMPFAPETRP